MHVVEAPSGTRVQICARVHAGGAAQSGVVWEYAPNHGFRGSMAPAHKGSSAPTALFRTRTVMARRPESEDPDIIAEEEASLPPHTVLPTLDAGRAGAVDLKRISYWRMARPVLGGPVAGRLLD